MSKQLVKFPYKIHALETVEECMPCANGVYYATEEEALERCHQYLQAPGQNTAGFVIFRAITIVRPEARPVRVNKVLDDGSISETTMLDDLAFLYGPKEDDSSDDQ